MHRVINSYTPKIYSTTFDLWMVIIIKKTKTLLDRPSHASRLTATNSAFHRRPTNLDFRIWVVTSLSEADNWVRAYAFSSLSCGIKSMRPFGKNKMQNLWIKIQSLTARNIKHYDNLVCFWHQDSKTIKRTSIQKNNLKSLNCRNITQF